MNADPRPHRIAAAQPSPVLIATFSEARLFGSPPPDSNVDLGGAHVLPFEKVVRLGVCDEAIPSEQTRAALDDLLVRVRTKGVVL